MNSVLPGRAFGGRIVVAVCILLIALGVFLSSSDHAKAEETCPSLSVVPSSVVTATLALSSHCYMMEQAGGPATVVAMLDKPLSFDLAVQIFDGNPLSGAMMLDGIIIRAGQTSGSRVYFLVPGKRVVIGGFNFFGGEAQAVQIGDPREAIILAPPPATETPPTTTTATATATVTRTSTPPPLTPAPPIATSTTNPEPTATPVTPLQPGQFGPRVWLPLTRR